MLLFLNTELKRTLVDTFCCVFSDKLGNTPLLEAIKNGHDRVASALLRVGASLAIDDAGGFLCTTVARRDYDLLNRILANGMNPNSKNYDNRTPLHIAASDGLYSMTKLLIEAGASVFVKDRYNLNAYLCCVL